MNNIKVGLALIITLAINSCQRTTNRELISGGNAKCWEYFSNKFIRKITENNLNRLKAINSGLFFNERGDFVEFVYDSKGNKTSLFVKNDVIEDNSWDIKDDHEIIMKGKTGEIQKLTQDTLIIIFADDTIGLVRCGCSPLSPNYKNP